MPSKMFMLDNIIVITFQTAQSIICYVMFVLIILGDDHCSIISSILMW